MRPALTVLTSLMFFALCAPVAPALPAESLDRGMMFGGQWANSNSTSTMWFDNLSSLPAVVEVYTATWCENCVDVEHALDEVQDTGLLKQYHIHRAIGESQDPFGTDTLDSRWSSKYGKNAPPAVVFNGSMKKIGSVTDEASLTDEYTGLASTDLQLGQGTTSFNWASYGPNTGEAGWNLDIDAKHLENSTLNVSAWIVEANAEFEEGTNGLGTYPHIVLEIIPLGSELQGSTTIQLPSPHDGDDLQVHLIYEIMPIVEEVEETPKLNEIEGDSVLPFLSPFTLITLLFATAMLHEFRLNQTTRQGHYVHHQIRPADFVA